MGPYDEEAEVARYAAFWRSFNELTSTVQEVIKGLDNHIGHSLYPDQTTRTVQGFATKLRISLALIEAAANDLDHHTRPF